MFDKSSLFDKKMELYFYQAIFTTEEQLDQAVLSNESIID